MNEPGVKEEKLDSDKKLVSDILSGSGGAWEEFVERYTDWALYKAKEWCVDHCRYPAGLYLCGLMSISLQREGRRPKGGLPECDEGLDTYIWIFDQLKNRIGKYTGRNDCLLSTFVWTILNSRELYIDWLRWKYGRAF